MIIQRSIKKALQSPETVTGLDLRQAKPSLLFPEIERFINLEFIDLSNCEFLDWKDACIKLATLPKLRELKAFSAGIKSLPEEFGALTTLKKIDLSNNDELTSLPESFGNLTLLEDITLYGCGLKHLPSSPWLFPHLETLNLSQNHLTALPENFFDRLPALQFLFIEGNEMNAIPEGIGKSTLLQLLYAGYNRFTQLPGSIETLRNLETLWLGACPGLNYDLELIKFINCPIKDLNILGNRLDHLPSPVKKFAQLEQFNINSNKIENTWSIINELSHLSLTMLDIRFMGSTIISLEEARAIIPTLKEISCDTRTPEEYTGDITAWLTKAV